MGWVCTTQGRDEMHVPNRLGVLVTQKTFRMVSCTLYMPYFTQFFLMMFEMFYFRPRVCGALHYTLLEWF